MGHIVACLSGAAGQFANQRRIGGALLRRAKAAKSMDQFIGRCDDIAARQGNLP